MARDIVLITVDSWRYDTTSLTSNVSQRLSEQADLICAGAATNWVFPAILSGTYYPTAYNESGSLRSDLVSLPELLSEAGYATGGFVACNPYVSKWSNRFDSFWNADLRTDSAEWYSSRIEKWMSRGYRTALLKKRVSAHEVARRGSEWYAQQDSPRFLWMHIMEPHLPYYPGIKKARDIGLLDAYRSILSYQRNGDNTPEEQMAIQRDLYDKCVELFDEHVPGLLDFVDDDAMILMFGDHGEEFDHGHYDHERLYDECVRVPIFYKNITVPEVPDPVRQIDIAPLILEEIGEPIPEDWVGDTPKSMADQPAFMITPEPGEDLLHAGIRTNSKKLIKSFNRETGQHQRTEYFDLDDDPTECQNIADTSPFDGVQKQLDNFISQHQQALEMNATTGIESTTVQSRLEDLGYK